MLTSPRPAPPPEELSALLGHVEASLQNLGLAIRARDADQVATLSQEVHRALAPVVDAFGSAARQGRLPPALRQRLVHVGREVAGQRMAMATQQQALDRALALLMPNEAANVGSSGAYRVL